MAKSPDAFRTISEVADWLGVQAHVLRFWESKFSQVKPVKRAGGRRYYRPADMQLLGGIKRLLHDDGLTIKGVQKIIKEQSVSYVSDLSAPLDDMTMADLDAEVAGGPAKDAALSALKTERGEASRSSKADIIDVELVPVDAPDPDAKTIEPEIVSATDTTQRDDAEPMVPDAPPAADPAEEVEPQPIVFSHRDAAEPEQEAAASAEPTPEPVEEANEVAEEPALKPRIVEVPDVADEADIEVPAGVLAKLAEIRTLTEDQAAVIPALLDRMQSLRDRMASPVKE